VARILVTAGQVCVGLGVIVAILVFFFKRLRVQPAVAVPWRRMFTWGLVGLAGFIVSFFFGRGIPGLLAQYPTSIPLRIFFGTLAVFVFLAGGFMAGALTLLFGLAWSFAARAFGEERLPTWLGMPAAYYRDAFWIGVGGSGLLIGLRHVLDFASVWWPTLHRGIPTGFGDAFDTVIPGIGLIGSTVSHALLVTAVLVLGGAFLGAELRVRWLRLLLFFAVAATFVSSYGSPADFLKQFLAQAILLAVVIFGIRSVVRFNLLGLFLVAACTTLFAGASELLAQPDTFYRNNGYILLFALVMLLAWPLVVGQSRGRQSVS
jgi:hypothetical protein